MKSQVICHDIKGNEYEVPPSRLKFRPSVYGVLIEDGQVLLSRQWDGYDFPGGGVEIDETLEEAVAREFWEETGLKVRPLYAFHALTSFFKPMTRGAAAPEWNCPLIYLLVERIDGELSKDNCDQYESAYLGLPEWLPLDDLLGRKFYNYLGEKSIDIIRRAQAMQEKLPGRFAI
ncbi:MAG: NUDIX hydrolase [Patescibacteria group bacterium]